MVTWQQHNEYIKAECDRKDKEHHRAFITNTSGTHPIKKDGNC